MITYDKNLQGKVVKLWDSLVMIPSELGVPRADQMQGTELERICELAGRSCYDSMGTKVSRDSAGYHSHIGQVKHFSTIEHAVFTLKIETANTQAGVMGMVTMFNRPQLLVNVALLEPKLRVTLNLRHVVEWDKQSELSDTINQSNDLKRFAFWLGRKIKKAVQPLAPMIVPDLDDVPSSMQIGKDMEDVLKSITVMATPPETDNEKFISVFLAGGRGFSHEQVRHRFAMSQRSSRFCDESESPIVTHPLLSEFYADDTIAMAHRNALKDTREGVHKVARDLYRAGVTTLESWLTTRGVDKLGARKQARGAMRNDLPTSLYTEMIFTANLSMWKHMFMMRSSSFADAEIREVFCRLLPALQEVGLFRNWKMVPAPDGLGHCVEMP